MGEAARREPSLARPTIALMSLTLLASTACAGQPATQRFEEDGVEVVLSTRPRWSDGQGWSLTPEPLVVIGEDTEDPRYLFSAIRGGRLGPNSLGPIHLPDGQIVVGDLLEVELRFYDATGVFTRTSVGRGEGPAEMTNLSEVKQCVPGLVVARNSYQDEIVIVDAQGEVRERIRLDDNAGRPLYPPLSCNRKGQFLALDWGSELSSEREMTEGLYRSTVHAWWLDPEGFVIRDLGPFSAGERLRTSGGSGPHPLGKTTPVALGEDRAYIGTADTFEIEVWSVEGVLLQRWRRQADVVAITASDLDGYADPASPHTGIAEELEAMRRRFTPLPLPESFPAYARFLVDATEHLWVEHFPRPDDTRHLWSVFEPGGAWLGEVEVPPTFDITEIGVDYVLGVFRDQLDEQSVRKYGLRR